MPSTDVRELTETVALVAAAAAAMPAPVTQQVARLFSAGYLRRIGTSLTLDEVATILAAERLRESGLTLARSGDLSGARVLLAQAAAAQAGLAGEALWAAETFQRAALSYVSYRAGDANAAREDMLVSMRLSIRLGQERGYPMDYRVLHLSRNLIHIDNLQGNKELALQMSLALGAFAAGSVEAWPFAVSAPWPRRVELDDEQRRLVADDLIGEIALAASTDIPLAAQIGDQALALLDPLLCDWIYAQDARQRGDASSFLRYLAAGGASLLVLPQARRQLRANLAGLCRQSDRPELGAAIEAALG